MRRDHLSMLSLSAALIGLTTAELALAGAYRLRRAIVRRVLGDAPAPVRSPIATIERPLLAAA